MMFSLYRPTCQEHESFIQCVVTRSDVIGRCGLVSTRTLLSLAVLIIPATRDISLSGRDSIIQHTAVLTQPCAQSQKEKGVAVCCHLHLILVNGYVFYIRVVINRLAAVTKRSTCHSFLIDERVFLRTHVLARIRHQCTFVH